MEHFPDKSFLFRAGELAGGLAQTDKAGHRPFDKNPRVDGPDFNGYDVDFDEAMERGRMYADFEMHARDEACNLFKKEVR